MVKFNMKKSFAAIFILVAFFFTGCTGDAEKIPSEKISVENVEVGEMKIKISVGNKIFDATLENNPATQEFIKKLPLEVEMIELNGNEKYYKFDENFPSSDKNIGEIHAGDLMLYSSNYVVLFYKTFSTSYRYTRLGKIDNPDTLSEILGNGNIHVRFEK